MTLAQSIIHVLRTSDYATAREALEKASVEVRDLRHLNPAQERILYLFPDRSGVFLNRLAEKYRTPADEGYFWLDDLRPSDNRNAPRPGKPLSRAAVLIAAADRLFPPREYEAAARWIAERIGLSRIPYHSGLIVLEDGSTLHCSREHGGLFFSLPAPLEPTE